MSKDTNEFFEIEFDNADLYITEDNSDEISDENEGDVSELEDEFPNGEDENWYFDDEDGEDGDDNDWDWAFNATPVAVKDFYKVVVNGTLTGNVLDNDYDLEGDEIELTSINSIWEYSFFPITFSTLNNASVVINSDGSFTYTASSEIYGYDSFTYEIIDSSLYFNGTGYAEVYIGYQQFEGENLAPVVLSDYNFTYKDQIASGNLLENDFDFEGDEFKLTQINGVDITDGETITLDSGALLTVYENGDYQYDAVDAESLPAYLEDIDSFTYSVTDSQGNTASAAASIEVYEELDEDDNNSPFANSDYYSIAENQIASGNFLENDFDQDGDSFTLTQIDGVDITDGETITLESGALLTISANGDFSYNPNNSNISNEYFVYTIKDEEGNEARAGVDIYIGTDNNSPTAVYDSAFVNESTTVSGNLLANDSDVDGDSLALTNIYNGKYIHDLSLDGNVITLASGALVTIYENGDYAYDPNGAFDYLTEFEYETDSFSYFIADENGDYSWANVDIIVYGADEQVVTEDPDALYYTSDLDGTEESDSISGNSDDDSASGFAGDDILRGYRGDDTLHGGAGSDRVWGMDGDDIVIGGTGDDYVSGGAGDDVIIGSFGTDRLAGGEGFDSFLFFQDNTTPAEIDLVLDFEAGTDLIEVYTENQMSFDDLTITRIRDTKYTVSAEAFNFALTVQSDMALTLVEGDFLFGTLS